MTELQFWKMKMLWRWLLVMVAWNNDATELYLKMIWMVNFMFMYILPKFLKWENFQLHKMLWQI